MPHNQIMGRGQTVVKDHFSAVFGERRGRPGAPERAPRKKPAQRPFSLRQRVAHRRMALARHLKDRWPAPAAASVRTLNCELTHCYFRDDPSVRADLNALVAQGICRRSGRHGSMGHSARPFEQWPTTHREAFADWEASGGVAPSKWSD